MSEILYLCDAKRECCKDKNCYINGGNCTHTHHVENAKNFSSKKIGTIGHQYEEIKTEFRIL